MGEPLSAVDVLHPGPGEVVEVLAGEVLVFALDVEERRIPLATVAAGHLLVGCATVDGARLLATGIGGTRVRRSVLAQSLDADGAAGLLAWAQALGSAVARGEWPRRLLPAGEAGQMVPPGAAIAADEPGTTTWVRLTSGAATLCGRAGASAGPLDAALPLLRGMWLTAGLRCRVAVVEPPADAAAWIASLDLLGRLAVGAAVALRHERDAAAIARLEARSVRSEAAGHEAVDVMTSAVGGVERLPYLSDARVSAELGALVEVVRASGLVVDDDALTRIAAEIESGRDPIAAVAGACGARPRPVTLAPGWPEREGTPLYVQVDDERLAAHAPAALVWRRGWELVDPVAGTTRAVDAALANRVQRSAVEFLPVLPARPGTLAQLGRLALRGSRRELVMVLVVTAMMTGLSFATPFLMGQLASLFVSGSGTAAYVALFGALLLVVVAGLCWQAVRALSLLRARSRAAAIASGAVWERLMRQPATWHAQRTLGDRASQANAVNNASAALPDETVARLLDTATVVGSLVAIATTTSLMLAAIAALIAVEILLTASLMRRTIARARDRAVGSAAATTTLMEILRSVNRLRVAGAETRAFLRWAQVQGPFARADQSLRRAAMQQGVIIAIWPTVTLIVVVAATQLSGAWFGDFVTAQTASAAAAMAVASMTLSASGALIARQSLRMAEPTLASVPEGGGDGVQPGRLSGGLEVRDLVFRYGPGLPVVLDQVSLSVSPGEHVAIVGPSGCGKTTLMRVLLGLEEPESGVIAVDGRDLASLDRPAVRRQVGCVLQSSTLLPGTIKDNVDLGRGLHADDVWAALDAAAVGADVRALAMGLDTPVTDGGGSLSGGQRQRILIARALAGSPRMLVLDEATSALDNLTQAAVVDALERLRITRIVVAHRLSTIRHADRIIVMDGGRVVDQGTYDELVARPGAFKELAERQQA